MSYELAWCHLSSLQPFLKAGSSCVLRKMTALIVNVTASFPGYRPEPDRLQPLPSPERNSIFDRTVRTAHRLSATVWDLLFSFIKLHFAFIKEIIGVSSQKVKWKFCKI